MAKLYNRVKVATSTAGTGTVTLGAASSNAFLTFAEAGVSNADVVAYCIEEGNDFEIGIGTYTSAGTTLSRDTVTVSKISGASGTTKMTLAGAATVRIVARKEDILSVSETQTANRFYSGPSSGSAAAPTFRTLAAGDFIAGNVLQCLQNTYTTNADLSTAIPYDDTTPTNTEGTQVLSQAITPRDANSKILCFVSVWGDIDSGLNSTVALFRGSTCINAFAQGANTETPLSLIHLDSPASASAQTYTVRAGPISGSILRLNGISSARRFGGTSTCTLTVMEIAG